MKSQIGWSGWKFKRKMTETDGSSEAVILATAGYDHAINFGKLTVEYATRQFNIQTLYP